MLRLFLTAARRAPALPGGAPLQCHRRHASAAVDVAALTAYRAHTLEPLLAAKLQQLGQMEALKRQCDAEAATYPRLWKLAVLGFLSLQVVVLFDWTYIHFDWNLTEPITYLLGYSFTWLSLLWYGNLQQEFGYGRVHELLQQRQCARLYRRRGVDLVLYEQLRAETDVLQRRLRSLEYLPGK
ncbi:hypothetical protein STCU_00663 [Strigomonas culicis]|uniref:Calcium uniporter protein C-terminal domain-containing protein n=1 Tax=Strigomonas culicis TaxID=28005 RepID=S9V628_9TRYP|nr:hypothetical protein STCU_00663 [Strigomonas culicis]|eukprot:EPY36283.1 hypothetical protein STCU_00663 [Strigomonas culicis]